MPPSVPPGFNARYLWTCASIAALGGLLFGWDWVVIGGAKPFFESFFQLTRPWQIGWANSCALVGCLIGALGVGALSDPFGRKPPLVLAALLFVITSLGNAFAGTFAVFVAWRLVGGMAIGAAASLSPMYISEIAPAALRGRLVAINQLTIVIGILLAQALNWYVVRDLPAGFTAAQIHDSWYGQTAWRWMFGLTAVPAAGFFLGMLFAPESPRWLAKNGRLAQAGQILERIGGAAYAAQESMAIARSLADDANQRSRLSDLRQPRLRRVLMLGVGLAVFQQWCGINVIFNYAQEIFQAAGYDISNVLQNIAWTGSVNLVATVSALGFVDRLGRRPLMLFGSAALAVIYLALGACYAGAVKGLPVLLLVLGAIASYAVSLAPVTWVVISEIFPNRVRGAAMAVALSGLWVACFLLTVSFPFLNASLGAAGTFWLYAFICFLGFCFVKARLPETKGRTLEEIERELVGGD